ncbi:hypothetical protein ACFY2R_22155 [Micromonospora olivasterospora]
MIKVGGGLMAGEEVRPPDRGVAVPAAGVRAGARTTESACP